MKHVLAFRRLAGFFARLAGKLHAEAREHGLVVERVPHLEKPRVEVDLAGERRYSQQARPPYKHERRNGFVEESGVAVRCFFQYDAVASRPFRCSYLNENTHREREIIFSIVGDS